MNSTHKTILSFIGGFITGAIIIWAAIVYDTNRPKAELESITTTPTDMQTAESETGGVVESQDITVRNQLSGDLVTVSSVTLANNGWIVIHEETDGLIGNALGAVRKDAGTYTDVTIPLLRATAEGLRYWVVLYSDDNDRLFNIKNDFPLKDTTGNVITKSFTAN
tara:strand:+ start:2958 stop:3452 length:495 start_codon:yes stop_codon:yes gene_type:complete